MTLQEYLEHIIKLHARGLDVAKQRIIDAIVHGINLGPCEEYLARRKPKTVSGLFKIMQEYYKSDHGKSRRIKEMNKQGRQETMIDHTRSHGTKTRLNTRRQSTTSPKSVPNR
jgi:hypothetical protein